MTKQNETTMSAKNSDLVFRTRSLYDYHEDRNALVDLFRRCEVSNQSSMSLGIASSSKILFHCETMDYLRCMSQYPESYCHYLTQSNDRTILGAYVTNWKRVHFGESIMTVMFGRLMRVDPNRRRQQIARTLFESAEQYHRNMGIDYSLGYTLVTNTPSLEMQENLLKTMRREATWLHTFIIPATTYGNSSVLHKLTQAETERLWMIDMNNWIHRPIFSDLQRLMTLTEYRATFAVQDKVSGRFTAAATVWQPSNTIICDDRANANGAYHGTFWLIINCFQSDTSNTSCEQAQELVSALRVAAANHGIPFLLFHVEASSPFNELCRKQPVLAMATDRLASYIVSERMTKAIKEINASSAWLDPRDFSSLYYYDSLPDILPSRL